MLTEREPGRWSVLLDGTAGDEARGRARSIAAGLRTAAPAEPSLAGGSAGVALFFAYLAQVTGDPADNETAVGFLERAFDQQADGYADASLYEGQIGVAWALAHLTDVGDEDPNDAVDKALLALLGQSPWIAHYDLISGLVGLGVYALERLPRPCAVEAIERIVAHLDESAERTDAGLTWWTPSEMVPPPQRERFAAGYWNLGIAHGVPGVVAFLGHAREAGVAAAEAGRLADGAAEWLLAHRLPEDLPSRFDVAEAPGVAPRPSRAAWCYGDPGVAVALLAAGRRDDAIGLARTAARRPPEEAGPDVGLCHGAAGLGHVFNRLYQASGDPALAAAARFWLKRALDLPVVEPGFLDGQAGVGLALLAAATDVEPAWDRILLLSGATRG